MELGVDFGGSLLFWNRYLENAQIHGVDLTDEPISIHDSPNIHYHQVDCANPKLLANKFIDLTFDIIIDDASHQLDQQVISFMVLWPKVRVGGLYILEDINDSEVVSLFRAWVPNSDLIDMRYVKKRYDDILIIMRK